MALDGAIAPARIFAAATRLFPAAAKLRFANPLAGRFFAWRATQPGAVEWLIAGTGSGNFPQ